MVHIKEPLLLIKKSSSLSGSSGVFLSLYEWSLTICPTPYNSTKNVLSNSLNKNILPSFLNPHLFIHCLFGKVSKTGYYIRLAILNLIIVWHYTLYELTRLIRGLVTVCFCMITPISTTCHLDKQSLYSTHIRRLIFNRGTCYGNQSQRVLSWCSSYHLVSPDKEGRKEMFYLTTHSTHFIYGYMASDIWLRTILIVRKETRCRHIGYSFRLTARVLLYAPSHRQDSTYHGLCYTSRGTLAGMRNSSMGPSHEGLQTS